MRIRVLLPALAVLVALAFVAPPVEASFHLMQIEQAIGGICGNTTAQAVQLRLRANGQSQVAGTRLVAYDATGANPVVLISFPNSVTNGNAGARILVGTANFNSTQPAINADFTATASIPASYLAAGRLTFEDAGGTIYWSISWGGAAYTGSTTGNTFNDADGNFGPPFASALTSSTGQALLFQGLFSDPSTTNAADFAITTGAATFTNNNDAAAMVNCLFGDGFESGDTAAWTLVVP